MCSSQLLLLKCCLSQRFRVLRKLLFTYLVVLQRQEVLADQEHLGLQSNPSLQVNLSRQEDRLIQLKKTQEAFFTILPFFSFQAWFAKKSFRQW